VTLHLLILVAGAGTPDTVASLLMAVLSAPAGCMVRGLTQPGLCQWLARRPPPSPVFPETGGATSVLTAAVIDTQP
jgi:hypothetical protein